MDGQERPFRLEPANLAWRWCNTAILACLYLHGYQFPTQPFYSCLQLLLRGGSGWPRSASAAWPLYCGRPGPPTAPTPPQKGVGINIANIDPSVKPCEDFFHYASGNWLKNNPIPAAEIALGLFQRAGRQQQRHPAQPFWTTPPSNAAKAAKGSNAQKVGDFYASAMDSVAIEAGRPEVPAAAPRPHHGHQEPGRRCRSLLADPKAHAGSVWFGSGVGQDEKISTQYAVQLGQGGLSLPDRDYYLKDDARSKAIRAAYDTYLVNTFKMLGDNEATAKTNAAAVHAHRNAPGQSQQEPRGPARPLRQLQQDDGGRRPTPPTPTSTCP